MQKEKGVSTLILVIIIIAGVVVAVGGVFAYQYFATKTQPVAQTQQNQNQQQQTVNQQTNNNQPINQTAGWKTYTNTQYGFEFNYPTNWVIINTSEAGVNIQNPEHEQTIVPRNDFSAGYSDIDSFKKFVKDMTGKEMTTLKDFLKSYYGNVAEVSIAGKRAYSTIVSTSVTDYMIYIESGDGIYTMSTPYDDTGVTILDPENQKISAMAKEIISTFKFTK